MTDKQIIIHGVDVSGCIRRNDFKLASYDCYLDGGCQCKDNPNCYYKQLKRKEQECEELKKIIVEAKSSKLDLKSFLVGEAVQNEYEQQLDQLKAENETLKQYKGSKQASYEDMQNERNKAVNANRQLKKENEELKENLSDLKKDLKFQNDKISELELDLQNANSTIENLDLMRVGEYNTLIDDYDKLKQTLAEIKKLVEKEFCRHPECCEFCAISNECVNQKIIEKINEVEDE